MKHVNDIIKAVMTTEKGTTLQERQNRYMVRVAPAANKIVMAVVGVRGRGGNLAPGFASRGDCEIAYVCDVNSELFASRAKSIADAQQGHACKQNRLFHHFLPLRVGLGTREIYPIPSGFVKRAKRLAAGTPAPRESSVSGVRSGR